MADNGNGWRNRIVGHGEKPADQFQAHPRNFRQHPKAQRQALAASLNSVGWVDTVLENVTTGHLIDGHERIWQALDKGDNTPVPFTQVELSEDEELLVLSTFDPIGAMAIADKEMLEGLLGDLRTSEIVLEDRAVNDLLHEVAARHDVAYGEFTGEDETYSRKIEAPLYTPKGEKPQITDLYDDSRTQALIVEIEASDLPSDEKRLLSIAAQRHTVLNFAKIADYYAHSDPAVQRLMEDSALVIIDFNRAIELGFVQMTERIAELVRDEYGD